MVRGSIVVVTVAVLGAVAGCPSVPAGEGEGEGEGERELPDVGPPPSGYAETPPDGAVGDACATGQWWTRGDRGSSAMHPGGNCIACHASRGEGPTFTVAGTVAGALDDEDDCRGIPGARIELIGPDGAVFLTLETNAAGNFSSNASLEGNTPFTARISYDGRTREMASEQTGGACNSCHTAVGDNGAPGRIELP
ncbi:MAG: hypothetical protein HYS27_01070 [Deltaproteobacteria bacterium]|nr:hypothetical protein [Deltaproteobacteria bacterium]